jgi:hypothetical protein
MTLLTLLALQGFFITQHSCVQSIHQSPNLPKPSLFLVIASHNLPRSSHWCIMRQT